MKKLLSIVLVFAFVLSLSVFAESPIGITTYGKIKSANGATTRLYVLPGEYRSVVFTASNGASVTVLFKGSAWHKVKMTNGGQVGWVKAAELTITTTGNSAATYGAQITGAKTVYSTAGAAELRWGPDTIYDVMAYIPNGTYVWIYERVGEWTRVLLEDGRVGYVSTSLLQNATKKTTYLAPLYGFVQVTGGSAIWRKEASYSSTAMGTFANGKIVELLGEQGYFYRLLDPATGKYGYISSDIISAEGLNKTACSAPLYYDNPYLYQTDMLWYVPANQTLKVLANDGYVSRVQYDDVIAYITNDMLAY